MKDWGRRRRWAAAGLGLLLALALGFLLVAPVEADRRLNTVHAAPEAAPPPPEPARRLHADLQVADLHSDLLLWARDPLVRHGRGHTDVPRLLEGNVALQVFSVVTKAPWGQNYERTGDGVDAITLLAVASRWPVASWSSLKQRALHQARKLERAAVRSQGRLTLIRSRSDLERHLAARERGQSAVGALLAMEGMHPLEGDPAQLEVFHAAGFRMLGLTHFFDNAVAGSAHGEVQGGLTPLGRRAIERMQELGMLIDLAHASSRSIDDVLELATRPVVVSHTGVQGTCPGPRNLSDAQLRGVAATGGVVGIGFWPAAVCGRSEAAIVAAIRYAVDRVGAAHVALGSDFDGTTAVPFDAAGLLRLTAALLDAGFSEAEIRAVMGGNVLRVLRRTLPD